MGSLADEKNPAYFYAIDGHTAYWRDERGAVATDLETGDVRVVDADARNGFDIVDVEDDLIAFSEEQGTRVSQSADDAGTMLEGAYGSMADFSPNARYYAADADEAQVFDDSTGEQVRLDLAGYGFSTAFGWIGNDTVVVLAAKSEQASMELLTCTVPGGACTPYVDDLGTTEEIVGALPDPRRRDDRRRTDLRRWRARSASAPASARQIASSRQTRQTPPPRMATTPTGNSR